MQHVARWVAPLAAWAILTAASPVPSPQVVDGPALVIIQLEGGGGGPLEPGEQTAAESVVASRLAALPAAGASVTSIPEDRLRIEVPEQAWADRVERIATAPGVLALLPVPPFYDDQVTDGAPFPDGAPVVPILGNREVERVALSTDGLDELAIDLELTAAGAAAFDTYAFDHQGERLAIVLDGIVLSAPVIQAQDYDGRLQVSGALDDVAVRDLVAILSGGILTVRAEVLDVCPAFGECPPPSIPPGSPGLAC
jgi:preprotein translocase subunit SecD